MENHEHIKGREEIHVPEDEVSLSFHSQLIGQMKHQYSPGRVKHILNVSGMVKTIRQRKKKTQDGSGFQDKNRPKCM